MVARHLAGAELLLSATESQVKARDLRRHAVIHFATHGLFNDARPDRSAIVLGADDREDGLLQAREIYRLPLAADLVVLSACESGVGSLVTGEGMLGLVHALLSAGSSAALASLWLVDDRATVELMERFYTRASETSVAEALRAAQAEAAAAGVHPARWAAFAVFGDADQSLPAARWPHRRALFALAMTLVAVVALILLRKRWSRAD
jgi:CHAT domain-containing protein